jgi:hypothetical protein
MAIEDRGVLAKVWQPMAGPEQTQLNIQQRARHCSCLQMLVPLSLFNQAFIQDIERCLTRGQPHSVAQLSVGMLLKFG